MSNPTSADQYVPFIDVSQHQGDIDFAVMRARGVVGVKLRASHGRTQDSRVAANYYNARAAGYPHNCIGFYSFINPKRGSGAVCAEATCEIILGVTGGQPPQMFMFDVENYKDEPPDRGSNPVSGPAFSAYIRQYRDIFQQLSPTTKIIMYANEAYWDSPLGPHDPVLAAEFTDWIVARYPLYSDAAYQSHGYPPDPAQWAAYAWGLPTSRNRPRGPFPPAGAEWDAWQFSAGFNRQGPPYGCQSPHLDLNIIEARAWARWTNKEEPEVPDMKVYVFAPGGTTVPGAYASDGTRKIYCPSATFRDNLLERAGQAGVIKVKDPDVFAALGVVEGPQPADRDPWGVPLNVDWLGDGVPDPVLDDPIPVQLAQRLDAIEAKIGTGTGGGPLNIQAELGSKGTIKGTATPTT